MLQGFFPTSVFLDSTCFSPPFPGLSSPFYNDPRVMSAQQHPGHCASQPSSPNQPHSIEPPFTRPSRQEKLLSASAAPICIHGFTFPSQPSTLNQTTMHHRETLAIKKTPFQRQAGIVSRMYSSHIPGCQVHCDDVNALLRKELSKIE